MQLSLITTVILHVSVCVAFARPRQGCSPDYRICAPAGVTRTSLGPLGPGWSSLFNNIINAISPAGRIVQTTSDVANSVVQRAVGFCCSDTARCLAVEDLNGTIAMCWDRFTTNVFFPDGAYGTVVTGNFTSADGDRVDLVYGDYTLKNGQKGNIYTVDHSTNAPTPNTTTMAMPTPWTSKGVGSAIPATELGTTAELSTGTTVIPGSAVAASTAPSLTIVRSSIGCDRCNPNNTTIPGPTQAGSTRPASTSVFTTGIITPPIRGCSVVFTMPHQFVVVGLVMTILILWQLNGHFGGV